MIADTIMILREECFLARIGTTMAPMAMGCMETMR